MQQRNTDIRTLDHRTHIYTKPDMFIGSDERISRKERIYNGKMVKTIIDFVPACE